MKLFWEGSNHIKLRNNILNNDILSKTKKAIKVSKPGDLEVCPEGEEYSVMPN